ncbi:MAG: hypothetical protein II177_05400 [Lachnospiraceae bacterium]|nr:hypothetical protein [Lachnospiraceae bacterium]
MEIEITSADFDKQTKIITVVGIDISELRLQRLERQRQDEEPCEITFCFDASGNDKSALKYFYLFLKRQKAVKKAQEAARQAQIVFTWHMAIQSIVGTYVQISQKYRIYES